MQGTVRHVDPGSGAGDVLLDDGAVLAFGSSAFARSGLRLLRIGQRVRLRLDEDGTVAAVTLVTVED